LCFNFKPASIFMGDSGSLFLGSSLAVLAAGTERRADGGVLFAMAVPVLIMLLPIFDTTFVTLSRTLSSRSASAGGRDHTSHRLVAMGFSERQAVLILYLLAAAGGASAVALGYNELREVRVLVALLLLTLVMLGVQLARVKVYGGDDFKVLRNNAFTPLLLEVTYKRRIFEVFLDLCFIVMAYYFAYAMRFDTDFPYYENLFVQSLPIVIACELVSFFVAGVYRGVWRYFSIGDLPTYLKGLALGTLTSVIAIVYMYRFEHYSRGVFAINAMTLGTLVIGSRLSFRFVADLASRHQTEGRRALIYGAGDGGAMLVRELRNNAKRQYQPVGFIDDDPSKLHRRILGVQVLGDLRDIEGVLARVRPEVVIISTDKLDRTRLQELGRICHDSGTNLLRLNFRLDLVQPPSVMYSPVRTDGAPNAGKKRL
jgi:UDP-GlcNAc:undecaprenyl-phosphate GlcNAc-1-phosphate transferase